MERQELHLTKDRLLDAAEELFSDRGIDATSLRAVTSAAGANLASVNYHFESKDGLVRSVFLRRLEPLNNERLELLDALEVAAAGSPIELEAILDAWVMPALRMGQSPEGKRFKRLLGRIYSEPGDSLQTLLRELFGEILQRFSAAIGRTLPELSAEELMWRVHFMLGAMIHTVADQPSIRAFSGGLCDPSDIEGVRRRLIDFVSAGLRSQMGREKPGQDPGASE
ncbi:MAG: TetR/AcrR family transcriptional regulator [Planctomycetota bacterium]|nr:TetR/AcrR family transcriptional regulator [Planctomycetota bacterium]